MTEYNYDLLVIDSGHGGQSAALQAASLGKRVGLVERKPYLGGVSLQMRRLPRRMTIIGGGVIACEFATIFAPLGGAVSLVDSHDHLLAYLDEDIQQTLEHDLLDMGVQLHMQTRVKQIERQGERVQLETDSGVNLETDVVLYAFDRDHPAPAGQLPMAIYTIPELSYVGNTERELQEQGADYVVGRARFSETARGQIIGEERGFMKLLVDRTSRALVGVHIIGESASELVHIGQMAMYCGASVDLLANTVYNYPTLAHCYKNAALDCLQQLQG